MIWVLRHLIQLIIWMLTKLCGSNITTLPEEKEAPEEEVVFIIQMRNERKLVAESHFLVESGNITTKYTTQIYDDGYVQVVDPGNRIVHHWWLKDQKVDN